MLYIVSFLLAFTLSIILTPLTMKLSYKIGTVDQPNYRKVHIKAIPRLGGLAIFGAVLGVFLFIKANHVSLSNSIMIGATIIVLIGFLDDKFQLSPLQKLFGQALATSIVLFDGLQISSITIPFVGQSVEVSWWFSFPISFLWIIGITNAINLIDGLDGLAAGVSGVAASSILVIALIMGNLGIALLAFAIIGSTLGFLVFNFHPAKTFMGDTGSLLLGFLLAVLSVMKFKQITIVSLIVPIIILAVPITDTLLAIIRRKLNKQKIMDADKSHLHHRLLQEGLSHRNAVLFIYGIAIIFGLAAILLYKANLLMASIIFTFLLLIIELLIEKLNLINRKYRPLLSLYKKLKLFVLATNHRKS